MAEISINPAFPNILIVTGNEIYADNYVDELRGLIYVLSNSDPSNVKKGLCSLECSLQRFSFQDAHDKYANQEVSYLLQVIEQYKGIIILTTNQRTENMIHYFKTFKQLDP